MPCFKPLHAFDTGFKTEKGKPVYKICSGETEFIYKPKYADKPLSQRLQDIWIDIKIKEAIEIPCGKCAECRLAYARDWANRCMNEAKSYKDNYFITLTYNEENLPTTNGADEETGEVKKVGTLREKDLTKFMKDLRRYYEYHYGHKNIKFYACGEYGEKRHRPHYHLIIFNLPLYDLEIDHTNKNGNLIYRSKVIEQIWGKGLTGIGEVTWDSACYTARYVMKKQKGPKAKDYYETLGIKPEFVRMSRKPGIGREFYETNKNKLYPYDEMFISKNDKIEKVKPARYYDRLFDIEEPEVMKKIKENRQTVAKLAMENQLRGTDLSKEDYLRLKIENKLKSVSKLNRRYEREI